MELPELTPGAATFAVANIGAVNWGLKEFGQVNLVTEAGLPPEAAYGAVAVAGIVQITEWLEITEFFDS